MKRVIVILALASASIAAGAQSFHDYPCTEDCSGHEAGYQWAEENGIEDADDCGGKSNSFIEGCEVYVEENYGDTDDYDDEDSELDEY